MLEGGLTLVRAGFVAGLLSVSGGLVFRSRIEPLAMEGVAAAVVALVDRALRWWIWVSLGVAFLGIVGWIALQAAPAWFVGVAAVQLGMVVVTAGLVGAGRGRLAAIVATVNVAVQAGHGHAMDPHNAVRWLLGIDMLHLVAAAVWLGGLVPLLLVVRLGPLAAGARAARWFSPIGQWAVLVLAGSAVVQSWVLVGSLAALGATSYGWVVLGKGVLLDVLVGLALLNRYWFAPELTGADGEPARRQLMGSILAQTAFGLMAVVAAALLCGLPPGMDQGVALAPARVVGGGVS